MRNIDRIQSMSLDELTNFLSGFAICDNCIYGRGCDMQKLHTGEINCDEGVRKYLEKEVEE